MNTREYRVSYSMNFEAESAQEAAEMLAEFLTLSKAPMRGSYDVEDEDGRVKIIDLGEQRGEW